MNNNRKRLLSHPPLSSTIFNNHRRLFCLQLPSPHIPVITVMFFLEGDLREMVLSRQFGILSIDKCTCGLQQDSIAWNHKEVPLRQHREEYLTHSRSSFWFHFSSQQFSLQRIHCYNSLIPWHLILCLFLAQVSMGYKMGKLMARLRVKFWLVQRI